MPDTRVPLASLPLPTLVVDLQGSMLSINHAAKELFGYSHEDCLGWTLSDLLADEAVGVTEALLKLSSGESKVILEHSRARTRSGLVTPVHLTMSVFEAESRVAQKDSRVLVSVEHAPSLASASNRSSVVVHRDGTIISADDLFAKHVESKPSGLIGRNLKHYLVDEALSSGSLLQMVTDFCQLPHTLLSGCYGALRGLSSAIVPVFLKFVPCADTCVVFVEDVTAAGRPGVVRSHTASLPATLNSAWAQSVFENIPVILSGMCRDHKRVVLPVRLLLCSFSFRVI